MTFSEAQSNPSFPDQRAQDPHLEFWYEFGSTYSYPAAYRAEPVAGAQGVAIRWKPFLLGPIFVEFGWQTSPFNLHPIKGAYMWRDLKRTCDRLGLEFVQPENFPQNGVYAARVALALPDERARGRFSLSMYREQFVHCRDIAEESTIRRALINAELDPVKWIRKTSDAECKSALRIQTDQAKSYGLFGAPFWRCADGEVFWGNDRLEEALDWVTAHHPALDTRKAR